MPRKPSPFRALLRRALPLLAGLTATVATTSADASPAAPQPFLWRVDGGAAPSHLFGTIHASVALAELPSIVTSALDSSGALVLEADPGELSRESIWQRGVLPPPHNLETLLGAKWPLLLAALGEPSAADIRKLRPWLAATLVLQRRAGGEEPLDLALAARARVRELPVETLESAAFQLEILMRTTGRAELEALLEGEGGGELELVDIYRRGDFGALAEATAISADHPQQHHLLFAERNRRWERALSSRLEEGGLFVAVGAGHMPGRDGLLSLLHTRGYTTTRLG